jgi:hypothetical protein
MTGRSLVLSVGLGDAHLQVATEAASLLPG